MHRHSGIAFMTPESVHYGRAIALTEQRAATLDIAFAANPNRFKHLAPTPPVLPTAAWINPPKEEAISIITSKRAANSPCLFAPELS